MRTNSLRYQQSERARVDETPATSATATGTVGGGSSPASGISNPPSYPFQQHLQITVVLLRAMAQLVRSNLEVLSLLFITFLLFVFPKFGRNSGASYSQSPAVPPPIFPKDSPVFEFPDGNLQSALFKIRREDNEISFVMYYAHWDGNSVDAAVEFDKAARRLSRQITFVAVNCWWLHGSCRSRIQPTMYPVLLATVPTIHNGLQYTGIQKADEMVAFLRQICQPYTYITDMMGLRRLQALHGTVVVGYFDWHKFPTPPGLVSFQKAAWLAVEKDPIEPVAFAAVTDDRLARRLGLTESPNLAIMRELNGTVFYPKDVIFRAKQILDWTYMHRESVVEWLAPAGVKSTIMATQLDRSPAVVLFTSHHHRKGLRNDFYSLKEVALDYKNCNNSTVAGQIIDAIRSARTNNETQNGIGHGPQTVDQSDTVPTACDCCQTLVDVPLTMTTSHGRNVCQVCEQSSTPHPHSCISSALQLNHATNIMNFIVHGKSSLAPDHCLLVNYFYSPYNDMQLCCKHCNAFPRSVFDHSQDQCAFKIPTCQGILGRTDCRQKCLPNHEQNTRSRTSNTKTKINLSSRTLESQNVSHAHLGTFTGLACRTNRTVKFFAMRSEYFWVFAKRLGVSDTSGFRGPEKERTAVVLFDIEAEQQHLLSQDVTFSAIKHFIFNYTASNLTRHLRSSQVKPSSCSEAASICVQEVVSSTFNELILDNSKDVLLLYYAPWCGMCARIHHLYLTVARVFQNSSSLLIARIDGDANDLPWHLTPSSYPCLLLFPAGHKDRSVRFPQSSALNLPNIIQFVLQHASLPV